MIEIDRQENSILFEVSPGRKMQIASAKRLNYHNGSTFVPCDIEARRVNNAQLNGYLCTANAFSYAFQTGPQTRQNPPTGTIGFGKRGHWFRYRLDRVGYIHAPTRSVEPIGGAADYSTAIETSRSQRTIGEDVVTHSARLEWHDLWTGPDGAEIYATWDASSSRIKEDIVINQAAREAIPAPSTPVDETFFGFRFEIDLSDVPKIRGRNKGDDFDDSEGGIAFDSAADELIAFMPVDFAYVPGRGGRVRLVKRFYRESGQDYLFVGARVSELQNLLPGDIHFDPTITDHEADDAIDTIFVLSGSYYYTYFGNVYAGVYSGAPEVAGIRFDGLTEIASGSTINSASIEVNASVVNGTPTADVFGDKGTTAVYNFSDNGPVLANITETTASTAWSGFSTGANTSPDLADEVQEVLDTLGSLTAIRFTVEGNNVGGGQQDVGFDPATGTNPPLFTVDWTEGGGGSTGQFKYLTTLGVG